MTCIRFIEQIVGKCSSTVFLPLEKCKLLDVSSSIEIRRNQHFSMLLNSLKHLLKIHHHFYGIDLWFIGSKIIITHSPSICILVNCSRFFQEKRRNNPFWIYTQIVSTGDENHAHSIVLVHVTPKISFTWHIHARIIYIVYIMEWNL